MISDLEYLEHLSISCGSFSFASPRVPKFADSLQTLYVDQASIDNEQRDNLAHFRSLKELRADAISNVDFPAISGMQELESLSTGADIDAQNLPLLRQLKNLKILELSGNCCTYTAKEIEFVSRLKNLERLELNPFATQIGDLDYLLELPKLQTLELRGNVVPKVGQSLYFEFQNRHGYGGLNFQLLGLGGRSYNLKFRDYGGRLARRRSSGR
jgi:Leucine-rich repeat (LRR) protein